MEIVIRQILKLGAPAPTWIALSDSQPENLLIYVTSIEGAWMKEVWIKQ